MDERENLIERRRILAVTLLAVEQAPKVLEVCASVSGDNASLVRALAKAFEISEFEAEVITTIQVRRFTPHVTEQLRSEVADINQRLADLTLWGGVG